MPASTRRCSTSANLASNNELAPRWKTALLESYFDGPVAPATRRAFAAMQCASLLRETLWGMVSETDLEDRFRLSAPTAEDYLRAIRACRCRQFDQAP